TPARSLAGALHPAPLPRPSTLLRTTLSLSKGRGRARARLTVRELVTGRPGRLLLSRRRCQDDGARIGVAMRNSDDDRARRRSRNLLGPFDRQHAVRGELVEAEVVNLARIVQAIQID